MNEIVTQLLSFVFAAWRRRGIAVAIAWIVALLGWPTISLMPDKYESSAVVHVDTSSVLQPLLGGLTVNPDYVAEIDLIRNTLLRRPNLETVLRETDLDLLATSPSESEKLIQGLSKQVKVWPQGKGLFKVIYEDNDPQLAHDVVQTLLSLFVESNLGRNRGNMDTARRFIDDQIAVYEQRLAESDRQIAEFRQNNLGLLRGSGFQLGAYEGAKERVIQLESELGEAKLRRATLARELKDIPQFFGTARSGFGAGPPTDLAIQILQSQQTLDTLLARYTDRHPDVVVANRRLNALYEQQQKEIEAVAAFADALSKEPGLQDSTQEGLGAPNPVYEQIKIQLVGQIATIATLNDRLSKARAAIDDARSKTGTSLELDVELARMNRDHGILMNSYNQLLAGRETEQISRARDDQAETVRFRVLEPPAVAANPYGPNRLLFITLVLLVSIGSGFGFVVLLSISNETISNLVELRSAVGVTVLGSVSTAVCAGGGVLTYGKPAIFWTAASTFFATFATLWFIEVRLGLNQFVVAEVLTRLPTNLLQNQPII